MLRLILKRMLKINMSFSILSVKKKIHTEVLSPNSGNFINLLLCIQIQKRLLTRSMIRLVYSFKNVSTKIFKCS